ncbi:MAG: asparaginase [Candidatus Gastranaerophilales bacterium]|nr:asparaginase [Candidatus Gastranaerophilales bacterium]
MNYVPILDLYRSDYLDNRFFSMLFLYGKKGLKFKIGDDEGDKFYLRSLFKPIQASILTDITPFSDKELAVMQGSHSGREIHRNLVLSILDKIGLNETYLKCPIIPPLDTSENITDYTPVFNNCSGKHAMMLAYCVQNGLELSSYTDFNHPVQKKILNKLLTYGKTNDYIATKDGCTVPVYGLSMRAIARAFLNYYQDDKNTPFIEAYIKNPVIIGGANRTDTKITKICKNCVSKVGAGGFIYVYNLKSKEILIVKMAQDNNYAREIITLEMLYRLKWLEKREYDNKIYLENNEPIGYYKLNDKYF